MYGICERKTQVFPFLWSSLCVAMCADMSECTNNLFSGPKHIHFRLLYRLSCNCILQS